MFKKKGQQSDANAGGSSVHGSVFRIKPYHYIHVFNTNNGVTDVVSGPRTFTRQEADEVAKQDPDHAIRDLYNAIAAGDHPTWTMYIQVMTFQQAEQWYFNPFDLTKVWPHDEFPLMPVGKLTLNRNPSNYFAEVEQLAFSPAHLVPGIEPSPDKMLQGRLFSYNDTHRHRLGANWDQIPVNCPYRAKPRNYQRDGPMTVTNNQAGAPNYFPNSFSGPRSDRKYQEHRTTLSADVTRWNSADEDNFTQVGIFYNQVLNDEEKFRLCDNIASHLCNAQEFLQERAIKNFSAADRNYGRKIQELIDTKYGKKKENVTNIPSGLAMSERCVRLSSHTTSHS